MECHIVYGSDWAALYINGLKVLEGHRLDVKDVLEIMDIPVDTRDMSGSTWETEVADMTGFPDAYEDIP